MFTGPEAVIMHGRGDVVGVGDNVCVWLAVRDSVCEAVLVCVRVCVWLPVRESVCDAVLVCVTVRVWL